MDSRKFFNNNTLPEPNPLLTEIILRIIVWTLFICTELCSPFVRVIQPEEMWMYKYPHTKQYVSPNALWLIAIVIPMIGLTTEYARERNKFLYRQGVLCLTLLLGLNGFCTSFLKITVGRPRPDFFARCFPDNVPNDEFRCTGNEQLVMEGRKSFPSGHASFAFASMIFASLLLSRKLQIFDVHKGNTLRLLLCILPIILATGVAVSRTCDYHHHWQDVTFGAFLGTSIACLCYNQYYPSLRTTANCTHSNSVGTS